MAVSRKVERELIRTNYLDLVAEFLLNSGEEVLLVASNTIAIPVVGCEGNEDYLKITFAVPTGANKGLDPYNGHEEAENYQHDLAEKKRKAEEKAKEKEAKKKRDEEIRKKKEEQKSKG